MANTKDTGVLDAALNAAQAESAGSTSTTPTNTSIEANAAKGYNELEAKRKSLVNQYRNEPKVPVTISPFYAPHLGRVIRVAVNGIIVDIPADGQTYMINQTHADHVIAKVKRIDAMLAHQKRVGDVANNFETAPGELHL